MLTQVCHFPDVLLFQRKEENQTAVITVASDEHVTCVIDRQKHFLLTVSDLQFICKNILFGLTQKYYYFYTRFLLSESTMFSTLL